MSARLSNNIKDQIVIKLLYPHLNLLQEKGEKINKSIKEKVLKDWPKDLVQYYTKYPTIFNSNYVYFGNISINFPRPISSLKETFNIEIFKKYFQEEAKIIESNYNDYVTLRTKLQCVLSNINSVSVLKKEFPEAYEIYCKLINSHNSEDTCSDIEGIRAKLKIKTEHENQPNKK